jgi:subtilisin family serine protease
VVLMMCLFPAWPAAAQSRSTHQTPAQSCNAVVAVVDTGVNQHPRFTGLIYKGWHYQDTRTRDLPETDPHGHGTAVTGLIAGECNAVGIFPVVVADSSGVATPQDVARGIDAAIVVGAKIINVSMSDRSPAYLCSAVQRAWEAGAIVIAPAAGFQFRPPNQLDIFPAYPGNCANALRVGASDGNTVAWFSRMPAMVYAPGVDVSTYCRERGWCTMTGESFATAIVSGALAQAWATQPQLDPNGAVRLLWNTRVVQTREGAVLR